MPRVPSLGPRRPAQVGSYGLFERGFLWGIELLRCHARLRCATQHRQGAVLVPRRVLASMSCCAAPHTGMAGACLPSHNKLICLSPLRADDAGAETVLLLDDQTFEVMDRFQLDCAEACHRRESPTSMLRAAWLPRRHPPAGQCTPCARCCSPAPCSLPAPAAPAHQMQ